MHYEYGLWPLVVLNSAIFIIFAFSFTKPKTKRDWRALGAFLGFIVALFAEMYGFPLTVYLLSGWLVTKFPGLDLFSHESGHLWQTIFGIQGDAHFNWLHTLSHVFILAGFIILSAAWRVLHRAQRSGSLAQTGLYARVRHPQYLGFVLIMIGFLIQWPTLPTLVMFPILVWIYTRLAKKEEGDSIAQFGDTYKQYAENTPPFLPRLGRLKRKNATENSDLQTIRDHLIQKEI